MAALGQSEQAWRPINPETLCRLGNGRCLRPIVGLGSLLLEEDLMKLGGEIGRGGEVDPFRSLRGGEIEATAFGGEIEQRGGEVPGRGDF